MKMLILRLQGPLMAFGDMAVDEIRPTDTLPGLSQMTGLIANALGWTFQDRERLQRLQDRLRIAAREDCPGRSLRDYQTAQLNSDDKLWRSDGGVGLREGGFSGYFTAQRYRDYRADSAVTVLVSLTPADEFPALEDIAEALQRPARPLFVGRVSCPPALPVCWEKDGKVIIEAESFEAAFARVGPRATPSDSLNLRMAGNHAVTVEWPLSAEEAQSAGGDRSVHVMERCDRRRWVENIHGGRRLVWRQRMPLPSISQLPAKEDRHDS